MSEASLPQTWRSRRAVRLRTQAITYAVLGLGAAIIMVPFLWMLSTSLKTNQDIYVFPPQWIPDPARFANYRDVMTLLPFWTYARNSFFIVACVVVGTVLSSSFTAYGFARLQAPGRDFIFIVVLATLMLPTTVTLVPLYIGFNKIGWVNTFWPLIAPAFFGTPFFIFLLRQFYLTIPRDLEDAARLDGASPYRIWWDIFLPLSKPALATVAVFTFFTTYNDFFGPLIYLTDDSKRTLAVALSYFNGSPDAGPQMNYLMAMTLLVTIPSLIVFLIAQRHFVRSIITSGIKG
ncbi:MAG: carbohydrate ABC transporter permease [Thermomicrobiales bacterium]